MKLRLLARLKKLTCWHEWGPTYKYRVTRLRYKVCFKCYHIKTLKEKK